MIRNSDGIFEGFCDDCGDQLVEEQHFDSAVTAIKGVGEVVPDGEGGWTHRCRSCARAARVAAHKAKFRF